MSGPLDVLRQRQADAKAYSVYGPEGKWLVGDDEWVELHAAIDAALTAVERRLAQADVAEAAIKSALLRLDNLGLALAAWCPHGFDSSRAGDYGWAEQFTRELEEARAALAASPTDGGERHAEGLDERGIYGGRAYPDGGGAK